MARSKKVTNNDANHIYNNFGPQFNLSGQSYGLAQSLDRIAGSEIDSKGLRAQIEKAQQLAHKLNRVLQEIGGIQQDMTVVFRDGSYRDQYGRYYDKDGKSLKADL